MEQSNRPKNSYWFKDGTFKCKNCPYTSTEAKELVHHIKSHEVSMAIDAVSNNTQEVHSENSDLLCDICHQYFAGRGNLNRHKSSAHDRIRDYKCDKYKYTITRRENLIKHNVTMHGEISEQPGPKHSAFFKTANIQPGSKELETAQDPLMITVPTECPSQGIEEGYSWFNEMKTKMDLPSPGFNIHDKKYLRRISDRMRRRSERAKETQEHREARLQKMREYGAIRRAKIRSKATNEQLEAERKYEREKKREQRARETPEQREARLQRYRDYNRNRATNPLKVEQPYDDSTCSDSSGLTFSTTCENKKIAQSLEKGSQDRPASILVQDLLEYDRERKRAQRAMETPEQREERLQKAREYKKRAQRAMETPEQRGERLQKAREYKRRVTRERVRALRAKRTEEEKRQDRLKAKERMNMMRAARRAKIKAETTNEELEARETPEQRECRDYKVINIWNDEQSNESTCSGRVSIFPTWIENENFDENFCMEMKSQENHDTCDDLNERALSNDEDVKFEIGEWACEVCEYSSTSRSDLQSHIKEMHPTIKYFNCDVCGFSSKHQSEVAIHKRTVHYNSKTLQRHKRTLHNNIELDTADTKTQDACEDNDSTADEIISKNSLNTLKDDNSFQCEGASHNTIKRADKKIKEWVCDMCSYTTQVKDNLIEHVHSNHWKDRVNIYEEDFNDTDSLNQADLSNAEEESNLADEIIVHELFSENGFTNVKEENNLQCEVKDHTTTKIFGEKFKEWVCDTCGYSTELKDNLVKHVHVSSVSEEGTGDFPDSAIKDLEENTKGRNEASLADPCNGERSLLLKDDMNSLTSPDIMKGNENSELIDEIILNHPLTTHSENGFNNAKEHKTKQGEDASQNPSKITGQKVKEWVCDMCGYSTKLKDNLVKHVHNIHWGDMNEAEFNDTDILDEQDISNHDDEMMHTNEGITLPGKAT